MNIEPNNPSAESVEEEGEKVTGGATSNNNDTQENTTAPSQDTDNAEILTPEETKKEDVSGYNELPDQAKVAGG